MVIDFHTHVFPPCFPERREELAKRDATFAELYGNPAARMASAHELINAIDDAEIEHAVIMGVGWSNREVAREANDCLIESVLKHPGRLTGLASVSPAWGEEALEELDRCSNAGLRGVGELHPDTQGFDIADYETMTPIMDMALQRGLIVLSHASEPVGHQYPGKGHTTPEKLYALAKNFPQNTIVFAHWGGGLPFYTLMPEVREELRNVYYDTAASPFLYRPDVFQRVAEICGAGCILFGTDFPLLKPSRTMDQALASGLSAADKAAILGGNARVLLGLEEQA